MTVLLRIFIASFLCLSPFLSFADTPDTTTPAPVNPFGSTPDPTTTANPTTTTPITTSTTTATDGLGNISVRDLNVRGDAKVGTSRTGYIDDFKSYFGEYFFGATITGEKGAQYLLINIARDLKNFFMVVAIVYLVVLVFRLFFGHGGDEDMKNLRMGILWTSVGIIVMQIAYTLISLLFNSAISPGQTVDGYTATILLDNVVYPFVKLLQTIASFAFLAMAFYAFFRITTAHGEEDKIKKGKKTVMYAIIGFLMLKIPGFLISSIYGKVQCEKNILNICKIADPKVSDSVTIMTTFINYLNTFVGIVTVLLIIYAGWLVLSGGGDEEKLKKAKHIIVYALIGIFILVASYALFNFFVLKG